MFPTLTAHEKRLLLLLGVAGLFNQYDVGLLSLLLKHIQADLLIPDDELGFLGSAIRMGSIATLFLAWLADRRGRRQILLLTIVGYTLFTAATAFAPDARTFVALQFGARMFMSAEFLLAGVVIVEEFRPAHRAWGIGVVGILAVLGRGLAAVLFAFVDDFPMGWRGFYLVGVAPLLMIAWLRRGLPETARFAALDSAHKTDSLADWLRPFIALVRAYPTRFAAVGGVTFLWAASNGPVDFFMPKFLQEVHGWTPAKLAQVTIGAGALGVTGMLIAGWISDRYGRRPSMITFMILEPICGIALYIAFGPVLIPVFTAWVFVSVANDVIGGTYGRELFPTSARATAGGFGAVVGTLGSVFGLGLEGLLFKYFGNHWVPICIIAGLGFGMPVIVALVYPETSGRELEDVSPEVV